MIISEKEAINEVHFQSDKPVSAIVINVNDHAYCKVTFDQKTLDSLVDNLNRIEDPLTRGSIWRQLWQSVMSKKMSSLQYFELVVKQIPNENIQQIITVVLGTLSALVAYYIPTRYVVEKRKVMYDTLLKLLSNKDLNNETKIPIVDNLFGFLSDVEHIALAQ